MQLPKARTTELIEQEADKELLVYDLQTNTTFSLNETSKIVFKACDGKTSFDELKRRRGYSDEIIYLALDELNKNNLMEGNYSSPFSDLNRREVIKKVGLASMVALPVISSILAPPAATAQSVACAGNSPAGTTVSCANSANDCGTNANAATCQTCTSVFTTNFPNCIANSFQGACQCT